MSNEPPSLADVLRGLESRTDAFDLFDARDTIEKYSKAAPPETEEDKVSVKAELFVLGLDPGDAGETSCWQTHFGPELVTRRSEDPALASLTAEMVAYWKIRAQTAKHSRFRARYADAVWDLEPKIPGGKRDVRFAQLAIDAYVEDCGCDGEPLEQTEGLQRALHLAMKLRDEARVETVRDTILAFQKQVAKPDDIRLSSFHFDTLYQIRKKVNLRDDQTQEMIAGMEKQLAAWSNPSGKSFDPLSSRELGQRLAQYYESVNSAADVKRVVLTYGQALLHLASQGNALMAHHWLEEVHAEYLKVGLRNEADALLGEIRKAGGGMAAEMHPITSSIKVDMKEVDQWCDETTADSVEHALERIALEFVPDDEHVQKQLHHLAAEHPLQAILPVTIVDGFTRARMGPVQADESGRIVQLMHRYLTVDAMFLRQVLDRMVSRYNVAAEQFVGLLQQSALFQAERAPLLVAGIKNYLAGDHISCAHVLIPQIEHVLRRLLEMLGGVTVGLDHETGTYREKDLGTVLRDPIMVAFWKEAVKCDVALYLRVVLVDQRGMNARNQVCHGLCNATWFNAFVSDRLIHILMLLSKVRPEEIDQTGVAEQEKPSE